MSWKQFCPDGSEEETGEIWEEIENIITDFVTLEVEENISIERVHHRRNIRTK